MHLRRFPEPHGSVRQRLREFFRANNLRDVRIDDNLRFFRQNHAEEEDWLRKAGLAEFDALADRRNSEVVCPMFDGDARARDCPVPVRVRLDDDAELRAVLNARLDVFEIFGVSFQIDFSPSCPVRHDEKSPFADRKTFLLEWLLPL